jgi:hypothetical protein
MGVKSIGLETMFKVGIALQDSYRHAVLHRQGWNEQ